MAQRQILFPNGRATPSRTDTPRHDNDEVDFNITESDSREFDANSGQQSQPTLGTNNSPTMGTRNTPTLGTRNTPDKGNRERDVETADNLSDEDHNSTYETSPRNWRTRERTDTASGGKKRKHVDDDKESSYSSSSSSSSSSESGSESDNIFDPDNSLIAKGDTIPKKISKYISKYANQGISKSTRLETTKNCRVPNHKGLKAKQTDRFMKKLYRKKFFAPLSEKRERIIINTQSRILDAAGPLAILWNEADKVKKKGRSIDPRDVIDIVQRALVLIGNAHYVFLSDRRRSLLSKILPECQDLLHDNKGKKALLKPNAELFGHKFRRLLTDESKDNRELMQLLPPPRNRRRNRDFNNNKSSGNNGKSSGGRFVRPAPVDQSQFFQSGPSTSQSQQTQFGGPSTRGGHSNRGQYRGKSYRHKLSAFQDGGLAYDSRNDSERGFLDKTGFERRLFFNSNFSRASEISAFQMERQILRIQFPPVRDNSGSPGFLQNVEGPNELSSKDRDSLDNLFGRHINHEPVQGGGLVRLHEHNGNFERPGVFDKCREVDSHPHTGIGISGFHSKLVKIDTLLTKEKNKENPKIVQAGSRIQHDICQKVVSSDREYDCDNSSSLICPSTLPTITSGKKPSIKTNVQLRYTDSSTTRSKVRLKLVDKSVKHMEREKSKNQTMSIFGNYSDRRQPTWVGCSEQQCQDRGSLVTNRDSQPHKCTRVDGNFECGKVLSKKHVKHTSSNSNRQQNCFDIHKQDGGNSLNQMQSRGDSDMGMVPDKGHISSCTVHSRPGQYDSRLGVQVSQGLQQLDVGPLGVPTPNEQDHNLYNRPVCGQDKCPTPQLYELVPRSRCSSSRCSNATLGVPSGVCISPIQSDIAVSSKDQNRKGNSSPNNSSMECTTLVSDPSGNVNTRPNSSPDRSPDSDVFQRGDSPVSREQRTTVSRLGCFGKSLSSMSLSKQTEELLFKSWSKGTNSAYDSAWNKWAGWCMERETDPFSATVSSVLEFLSWMFQEGFQYRTINVHRSAISSVIPHINNLPIGQHHLIKNLMRGILKGNPPLPRYKEIWDVDTILNYLLSLADDSELSLKVLSKKLVILLAITAPKRASEIARLDKRFMLINSEGAKFQLPGLCKTQKDCNPKDVFYARFLNDKKLCVVECLCEYVKRSAEFRLSAEKSDPLIRTIIKPHKGVTPNTISNWIKDIMSSSGIDIKKFKAHSTRGASTSKAACKGVSVNEILDMADWTNASTFRRFYHRNPTKHHYANAVLTLEHQ